MSEEKLSLSEVTIIKRALFFKIYFHIAEIIYLFGRIKIEMLPMKKISYKKE